MLDLVERKDVFHLDTGSVRNVLKAPEGFMTIVGIPTRVGVFPYRNPDGSTRRELRHPDDVLRSDSLATLGGKPFTVNHPPVPVTPTNFEEYGAGSSSNEIEVIGDGLVKVVYNVHREDAIRALNSGFRQLSCGYRTDLLPESGTFRGQPYDARQTNIRYNHTALVGTGRAGPDCGLRMDGFDLSHLDISGWRYDCAVQIARADQLDSSPIIFDLSPSYKETPMAKLPENLFADGIRHDGMDTDLPSGLVTALTTEINAGHKAILRNDELEEELAAVTLELQKERGRADALDDTCDEQQEIINRLTSDMDDPYDDVEEEEGGELDARVDPTKKKLKGKKDMSYKEDEYDEVTERLDMWNEAAEIFTHYGIDPTTIRADSSLDVDEIKQFVVGALNPDIRTDGTDEYYEARYDLIAEEVFNSDEGTFNTDSITHADNLETALGLSRRSVQRADSRERDRKSPSEEKMARSNSPGALHK